MVESELTSTQVQPRRSPPDAHQFDALYRDSRDDLFAYVTFLVADRGLAEEITAEAFERAFRKRSMFHPAKGDLRGWLFKIARNIAVDELRRAGRGTALELAPGSGPDESTSVDDRLTVAAALRALPVRERELIALKFFAGLDNDQIARVLRISRSNAGTQLHRAMTRLRGQMEGAGNGS